jgi:hypothetical protein
MAINPNTDFTSGAILTADQQNRFPRGILSFAEKTTGTPGVTAETVVITLPSFTAVANRYYRVTGHFPIVYPSPAGTADLNVYIRKGTTTGGTTLQHDTVSCTAAAPGFGITIVWVGTLSAGAQQMVLTASANAASQFFGSATRPAQFFIEDIGPA